MIHFLQNDYNLKILNPKRVFMEVMTRSKIIGSFFIVLFLFTGIQQQIKGMEGEGQKEEKDITFLVEYSPVKYSPDNSMVAAGRKNGDIEIYNKKNGKLLVLLSDDSKIFGFVNLIFWLNNEHVISGYYDGTICLWDLWNKNSEEIKILNDKKLISVACSPKDQFISIGFEDGDIYIFNGNNNATLLLPIKKLTGHTEIVHSVAWLPNSKQIVTGYFVIKKKNDKYHGIIRIFNVNNNGQLLLFKEEYTDRIVESIGWLSDGKRIFIGTEKETSIKTVSSMFPKGER